MWYLWINRPSGEYEITDSPERFDAHFDLVDEYDSEEDARDAVWQIKSNSTVYAVFFDGSTNRGYVSREDDLSGNWRGSRDYPYWCMAEFISEDEAEAYLADLLR
jgi:hypothetical protein